MDKQEKAILAGGCFWGMQDLIRKLPGVSRTRVGYTGGDVPNATYRNHGTHAEGIEIWFDPTTGEGLLSCPWLEQLPGQDKYACKIYFDRPDECKHYPVTIDEMIRDECEMLEPRDLLDRKKAQRQLDLLMADSRPPLKQG